MSESSDDAPLLSPSTLNGFLGCEYQAYLNFPKRRASLKEHLRPPQLRLLQERGDRHEVDVLDQIRADKDVVEIVSDGRSVEERSADTLAAMEAGRAVIYQGCLVTDGWRGYPDFLIRVDSPSGKWDWSYEVFDAKLARSPEPRHIYQLLFYSEALEEAQGVRPKSMHLIVGSGETESFSPDDFSAYADRIRDAFVLRYEELASGAEPAYPYPVAACDFCDWWKYCDDKRREDDHLSLTAGLQRSQGLKLEDVGIHTVNELASIDPEKVSAGVNRDTLSKLHEQADLQNTSRDLDRPLHALLVPEYERGLVRLPSPSDGDVFFDFEGDPYWGDEGLEYLFGSWHRENDDWKYTPIWAKDRTEERAATEQWIDWIVERLRDFPDMHIFHFNSTEQTKLKSLTQRHATREEELDDLLRRKIFVDLLGITRQSARIGVESYGLKAVEAVYGFERNEEIDGVGSLWRWQRFLEDQDDKWLDEISAYNADDCMSTHDLYSWLLERKPEAESEFGIQLGELEPLPEKPLSDRAVLVQERTEEIRELLVGDLPENESEDTDEQRARRLVFALTGYHRREQKPGWWEFFDRLSKVPAEFLEEDNESLAGLELTEIDEDNNVWVFTYPEQEHKMKPASSAIDAVTERSMSIDELDDRARRLTVKIGRKSREEPPVVLMPKGPLGASNQEDSVYEFSKRVAEVGLDGADAQFDLTLRRPPRFIDGAPELVEGHVDVDRLAEQIAALDGSVLVVQGPPGTGKTYSGSHAAVRLVDRGLKVGVMSTSHAAIDNFLKECDEVADDLEVEFSGWHKGGDYESDRFRPVSKVDSDELSEDLHSGTAWHWSRPEIAESVDVLFIDEAGQVSLADAVAVARAAKNVVLLGDPQQLPHVSQGTHLFGSGASVLEHMLGDAKTISSDRGVFLDETWRMHPDLCDFVSRSMYDGRLTSEEKCANQLVESTGCTGTGIRMIEIEHADNRSRSVEEAEWIAEEVDRLVGGGTFCDRKGKTRPISLEDVLVVAPFNAQVRCLKEHLPDGARVGTVDKFQGQQAPVVIFSMASSSGDDVSRGLSFLMNSNRLNVAISRAQALAIVVCSPSLFTARCSQVQDMKLVNMLCRIADEAGESQN